MIDYNRRETFYLSMFDPRNETNLKELQTRDKWAARDIDRLHDMIDTLQEYRSEMATRAAYLLDNEPVYKVVLKRYRHYKGSVTFQLIEYSTYPDGTERADIIATYPGKARAQALKDFRDYQKTHTGIPCELDIEKSPWER